MFLLLLCHPPPPSPAVREVCEHRGGHPFLPPELRLLRLALQRNVPLQPRRPGHPDKDPHVRHQRPAGGGPEDRERRAAGEHLGPAAHGQDRAVAALQPPARGGGRKPLAVALADHREGEGEPGGAGRAVPAGAPGPGGLRQHQERHPARADSPGQPFPVGAKDVRNSLLQDHHVFNPAAALPPGDPAAAEPPGHQQQERRHRARRHRRGPLRGGHHRGLRLCWAHRAGGLQHPPAAAAAEHRLCAHGQLRLRRGRRHEDHQGARGEDVPGGRHQDHRENRNRLTQVMLLKSLLQVSTGFRCGNMLTALPSSFLDRLLSAALMEDAEIRLFVLQILIGFIDRHGNKHKFQTISTLSDISVLKLKVDKCSRQDTVFMKKHAQQLYRHIYLACKEADNGRAHYEALYSLLALISIELANEEVVVDLIRLVLAMQELAQVNEDGLPLYSRCALYALGAAYLNLISQLTTVPAFCQHIHEVIEMRQKEAPYLLPEGVFAEKPRLSRNLDRLGSEILFRQSKISEVLGGSGYNSDRLSTPYVPQLTDEDRLSKRKSIGETISLQVEVESRNSPEKEERAPAEEITYETLKKAIVDSVAQEQERERRRLVVEKFQKAPFEEIAAHCGARATLLQSKLNQIFEITIRPPPSPSGTVTAAYGQPQAHSIPVYEMKFPDLCVY
ncbi:protein EFR3 homolog B isoform X5 [Varanus komodoensis]|uniref:protein EFR3 homolog B isoform X5 n=1 Tax=Varanus komodoensis TaxID=61221 RepID=UPI001CF7C91D|nr:protein EFR3 homolog B isoform X5 [Varanus komodoensis]